ncbi:Gp37-like protein [Yinghuangia sp. YIM S09857]|uniref:Gp37-like protein n=1 Tax=Yinghuangia sp. YIM S09857 TaxID=3436929 RepID=UPI003F52F6E9
MGRLRIVAHGPDRRPIGEIDSYRNANVILRASRVSSWTITIRADDPNARLLAPGHRVTIWMEGVARPLLTGPAEAFQVSLGQETTDAGTLVAQGVCDTAVLKRAVVFPDPTRDINAQAVTKFVRDNVQAGALIAELIKYNVGPYALAPRRHPNLVVGPDSTTEMGAPVSRTFRFGSLYDAVTSVADEGGLSFRLVQDPDLPRPVVGRDPYSFVLDMWPSRDRSPYVRFSRDIGNLTSAQYSFSSPKATHVIVASKGTDGNTGRYYHTADYPAGPEWGRRVERYAERDDVDPPAVPNSGDANYRLLRAASREEFEENRGGGYLSVTPIDTEQIRFGRDYWPGDRVSCSINGLDVVDVVREVTISDTAEGFEISPTIGGQDATETPDLYVQVRKLWTALGRAKGWR